MITETTSLNDVAGIVASALQGIGYDPIVVGGSAATMHAPEAYRSLDIDMVAIGGIDRARQLIAVMNEIGYRLDSGMFVHSRSLYTVDFVPSPVAIGGEVISDFAVIRTTYGTVRVLTATDAVCDRLNKHVVWSDWDSLDVAVAIAKARDVDMERIEDFLRREGSGGAERKFELGLERFRDRLFPEAPSIARHSFSTIVEMEFIDRPDAAAISETAKAVRAFLNETRGALADLTAVGETGIQTLEGRHCRLGLELRHDRNLSFAEQLHLATETIAHLRSNVFRFPSLADFVDDDGPPIAST